MDRAMSAKRKALALRNVPLQWGQRVSYVGEGRYDYIEYGSLRLAHTFSVVLQL